MLYTFCQVHKTGVGAAGGKASSVLATFLQTFSCFCFQVPQKVHGYIRNGCSRVPQVCWARSRASFCRFWNQGQLSMTISHHHLPVHLCVAGGLVLTCDWNPMEMWGKMGIPDLSWRQITICLTSYASSKKDLSIFWRNSISWWCTILLSLQWKAKLEVSGHFLWIEICLNA